MNHAARLADDPRLTLWIELLTISHLVGQPAPRPDRDWLTGLTGRGDRRTLECALAHRVDSAVDTRYIGLEPHYQPERLAEHLTDSALATLDGRPAPCDGAEYQWQAGRYRWADVFHALKTTDSATGPHPGTEAWAARGLVLSAATTADQLTELRAHPDSWLFDDTVITGRDRCPSYLRALARLDRSPNAKKQFLNATRFLRLGTTWPLLVLRITDSSESSV